jgi:hypothetical protein
LTLQLRSVTPAARGKTSSLAAGLGAPGPRPPAGRSWVLRPALRLGATGARDRISLAAVNQLPLLGVFSMRAGHGSGPQRAAASLVKGHAVPRGKRS